jgi:protein-tyrosine phosphatase
LIIQEKREMENMKTIGFIVGYQGGAYEITRDAHIHSPRLYYDWDPEGSDRKLLCVMEDAVLTLPSPLPGERLYFFLEMEDGFIGTAASRGVEIAGVENFRDLGGYQTEDGRQVKWGRFFRGGPISGLGQKEKAAINKLGLKKVFDYRTQKNTSAYPTIAFPGRKTCGSRPCRRRSVLRNLPTGTCWLI